MGDLRVLSTGVDTLQASARGAVRADVWEVLDAVRTKAAACEAEPVELGTRVRSLRSSLTAGGSTDCGCGVPTRADAGPEPRSSRPPWRRYIRSGRRSASTRGSSPYGGTSGHQEAIWDVRR